LDVLVFNDWFTSFKSADAVLLKIFRKPDLLPLFNSIGVIPGF
jgi:hypothetical protein